MEIFPKKEKPSKKLSQLANIFIEGNLVFLVFVIILVISVVIILKVDDKQCQQALDNWVNANITHDHPLASVETEYVGTATFSGENNRIFRVDVVYKYLDGSVIGDEVLYVLIPNKKPLKKEVTSYKYYSTYNPTGLK